ncbi:MAG: 3-dehydroquinate dehydratase-2 [Lentimonas sp.]|jgi:3-dehydroquinate dehydratase-2
MKLLILNGPNLNLIGQREPQIYGNLRFEDKVKEWSNIAGVELEYFQSNIEGELIDALQKSDAEGIVFNAGGYTHTSVALRDAISAIKKDVIEVHMSNILTREEFRHTSVMGPVCIGSIMGFGMDSYELAIKQLLRKKG